MKPKVKRKDFVDWYFFNKEDAIAFTFDNVVPELIKNGKFNITVEELFSIQDYIPSYITNNDDGKDYLPGECELTA